MLVEARYTTDKHIASHKLLTAISKFHKVFAFENESWVIIFVARCQEGLAGIAISESLQVRFVYS